MRPLPVVRLALLASLMVGAFTACGSDSSSGDGDSSSAAGASSSGAAPCTTAAECPGADDICQTRTCVGGLCGADFAPQGTEHPTDLVGDCVKRVCDGAGVTIEEPEPSDTKSDGKECTVEACGADGSTTFTAKEPGAACTQDGGRFCQPDGACLYCPPIDAACSDHGDGEPNDTEGAAHDLGTLPAGDEGLRICGVLPGADVDWYTYLGDDDGEGAIGRTLANASVQVCKFVECQRGDTSLKCPSGTKAETSPGGLAGCCHLSGFDLPAGDLCPDSPADDARIWVRLTRPTASADDCVPYELELRF